MLAFWITQLISTILIHWIASYSVGGECYTPLDLYISNNLVYPRNNLKEEMTKLVALARGKKLSIIGQARTVPFT